LKEGTGLWAEQSGTEFPHALGMFDRISAMILAEFYIYVYTFGDHVTITNKADSNPDGSVCLMSNLNKIMAFSAEMVMVYQRDHEPSEPDDLDATGGRTVS
jgi:hypothetical protein